MKKCFVIMPFSETKFRKNGQTFTIPGEEWDWIFEEWIKKAVESYTKDRFKCVKSTMKPGNFVKGIVNDLYSADITIADLTGGKPNVYYELGVRHGLKNGNIIITQDSKAVPSDLKAYNYFEYNYSGKGFENKKNYELFVNKIHEKIELILVGNYASDNPVSDFISKSAGRDISLTNRKVISSSAFKKLLKISPKDYKGLEIAISFYKEDFSWISDFGKELISVLNSNSLREEKINRINSFLDVLEKTFTDQELIQFYSSDTAYQKNFSQNYRILQRYLENVKIELLKNI